MNNQQPMNNGQPAMTPVNNPSMPPQPQYGPNVNVGPQPINQQGWVDNSPLSPWAYIGYMLLFSIPLVGLIMMFVFGFGQGNVNRKNFARAYLILIAIGFVLGIIMAIVGATIFTDLIKNFQ